MTRDYLRVLLLFILTLSCVRPVFAQNQLLIKGGVLERGSSTRIPGAQIMNKRTGFAVRSNTLGLFELNAVIGDTLQVIKQGYSDAEIAVRDEKDILVYLVGSTTLNEVIIRGESKKQELDALKRDFRNKGSFYQGKPPFLSFIFTPLTALYEAFGRTPKNARRFGNYYTNELQQTHLDKLFNESLIKNTVPLDGANLENYMINYRPDHEKAKNWTQYDAIKYIRTSYKSFTDTLGKN
jgi:hypothetical protein